MRFCCNRSECSPRRTTPDPGQVALAWLLAQHPWIVPIPGTRRAERIAENATATQLALSADDIAVLDSIARRVGVHGNRYNDHHMALVGR